MTEQEMREKYQGICQLQMMDVEDDLDWILEQIIPLTGIPFHEEECRGKLEEAEITRLSQFYLSKHPQDPRCFVFVDYNKECLKIDVVIRVFKDRYEPIKTLLEERLKREFQDTLIVGSCVNEINNRYGLDLDCVTKYDLRNTFRRKTFWIDYLFVTIDEEHHRCYPEFDEPVRLPVTEHAGLILNMDLSLPDVTLYLYHPSTTNPIELGWDDIARWYPYVFRWDELEKICHALENQFPENPKIPLLLLFRFATVTKDEDLEKARRQLEEAWRSLDLFSVEEIREFMDMIVQERWKVQREDVYWVHHSDYGWVMEGEDFGVYSLRVAENDKFPFDLLQDVIQHGSRTTG